jgi:membrane-bound lytic murein transglycosylase D
MLKRKLLSAGLICGSFVFMAASSNSKSYFILYDDSTKVSCKAGHDSVSIITHAFDANGLCICLPNIETGELDDAPRIQLNANAVKFVQDHMKKNSISLDKIREKNGAKYFTLIDNIFTQHGLPVELKYLAVIESQLNTHAKSRVGARGMWQFMPSTARLVGLKVKGKYDERLYAFKSTVAAAKYLKYLHRLFDDWLLTIAAYNAGPGYVYAAIKKSGSRNFWALQQFLPLETRNHVKKFISTHYYYEGHGGVTTLTKSETQAHISAVASWVQKQKDMEEFEALVKSVTAVNMETETIKLSQE